MEEAPENGKESPHSVHANGLIDYNSTLIVLAASLHRCMVNTIYCIYSNCLLMMNSYNYLKHVNDRLFE